MGEEGDATFQFTVFQGNLCIPQVSLSQCMREMNITKTRKHGITMVSQKYILSKVAQSIPVRVDKQESMQLASVHHWAPARIDRELNQGLVLSIISKCEMLDCLRKAGVGTNDAYSLERSRRKSRATQY
jgi:hypothetical protein